MGEVHIKRIISKPDPEFQKASIPSSSLTSTEPRLTKLSQILESSPPPALPSTDIVTLRNLTNGAKDRAREALGSPPPGVQEYSIQIPIRDGTSIPAWITAPATVHQQLFPILLFFHGGGFGIGNSKDETESNRLLALKAGIIVVSVEYRLAPEYKFPTCIHNGVDALKWVSVAF